MPGKVTVKPIKKAIYEYLRLHNLEKKFQKAIEFVEQDIGHPSLNVELLEPST